MTALLQDLRYGFRMFAKNPGFTAVAVLSLALGIGANSTVFSIVDKELLRSWPVKDPGRLVVIEPQLPKYPEFHIASYTEYLDIRNQVSALSDVVAYGGRGGFVSGEGQGREVTVEVVSENYFTALGIRPVLGRTFSPRPDQAAAEGRSVVLSYALWQTYFHGDPNLAGKTTLLDGKEFTIIGVAPREFCGLHRGSFSGIWVTLEGWFAMIPGERAYNTERDNRWFEMAGYLRPASGISEARVHLDTLAKRLAAVSPSTNQDVRFLPRLASEVRHEGIGAAIYFMAMVGLVLLISCANVANLLLAQTERRQREIAMRQALGARGTRLVGQLLTEGLVLSCAGGAVGVLLAWWLMKLLPALLPGASDTELQLDGRVLIFAVLVSLLTTLIFGLVPSFRATKCDLVGVLKGEVRQWGHATSRLPVRSLLVAGEIALSVVLLTGSALLLRSLVYSLRINPGFDPNKNVLMLSVAPPTFYGYSEAQAPAIYPALAARVASLPGVVRVSYARRPPLVNNEEGETKDVIIPGVQPSPGADHFEIRFNIVAPGFFATVGGRIRSGREFNQFDGPSSMPVVIINEAMARKFWPGQDAVGKSIRFDKKEYRIVGIAESGKYVRLHEAAQPYLFLPFTQVGSLECYLFVETAGDPHAMIPTILKATAAVDSHLPIVNAVTFGEHMQEILAEERSMARLLAGLSILGMFLAAVGLYASVAYLVARRTHEVGIRMALGARRADVMSLVVGQGLRLAAVGAGVGLVAAFAASRLMTKFIYGVTPTDPLSYAASILVAVGVALLALYFPARRATKVDPIVALRYE